LLRDPLGFLSGVAAQYGDIVSLPMGSQRFYLLNHPDHFKHVLQMNNRNYHKGANLRMVKNLLGEGLFISEDDFWRRQRRLVQPAFHHQRLAMMSDIMVKAALAMGESWQSAAKSGQVLDISRDMRHVTLQIIVQTMFSSAVGDDGDIVGQSLEKAFEYIARSLWLSWLPDRLIPGHRQYQQSIEALNKIVYRLLDERRKSSQDYGDLLTMLLQVRDEETGEGMTDKQVRDEVLTIFIAGHETTATTMSWIWHLIAQHPEVEQRLHAELATVLGGRAPTFQDVPQLTYTKMVIEEAMRLYSTVWLLLRTPVADDTIGGYTIPAGSIVMMSTSLLHRHPAFWEEPDRFDPDRFTPEKAAARPRFAYIPFNSGPRQCIGNSFAMVEMQLTLATLAQQYRLRSAPGHVVEPRVMSTLHPRNGVHMIVEPRSHSGS
jgi:cytochrome P450